MLTRVTVAKQLKVLVIKEESSELASLSAFFPWLVTLDRDQRGNVSACKVVEKSSRSPEMQHFGMSSEIIKSYLVIDLEFLLTYSLKLKCDEGRTRRDD